MALTSAFSPFWLRGRARQDECRPFAVVLVGENLVIVVPTVDAALVTPHTEAFQPVVWHCLVSHPKLQIQETKWESAVAR